MNKKSMKGACLTRGKETFACSSLGFRRKEKEYDAAQDEKGGVGVWH